MELLQSIEAVRTWKRLNASVVVLVPTMGALHEGHLELMREARRIAGATGRVIVSIFVNPTQFGPNEDFDRYPRELKSDLDKCQSVGVDAVFAPQAQAVYSSDRSLQVLENDLSTRFCGASRPGHFDGVCLVVLKLFLITQANLAVFGKKDYQQLAIIRRMVRDLNVPIEVMGLETVRESDELALSSRNRYLTPEHRQQASAIRRSLKLIQQQVELGQYDTAILLQQSRQYLQTEAPAARIDYLSIADRECLQEQSLVNAKSLVLAAVYFGNTRLIDNLELQFA